MNHFAQSRSDHGAKMSTVEKPSAQNLLNRSTDLAAITFKYYNAAQKIPTNCSALPDLLWCNRDAGRKAMAQRVIDLSLTIEDNIPAHKLFQRPVITTHMSHESTKALNLGVTGDPMTFQT